MNQPQIISANARLNRWLGEQRTLQDTRLYWQRRCEGLTERIDATPPKSPRRDRLERHRRTLRAELREVEFDLKCCRSAIRRLRARIEGVHRGW